MEHFTRLMGIYPVGSFVKLESGEMGLVIRINRIIFYPSAGNVV